MIQIYLFLCLIILVLILLSINIKIGKVEEKNNKKKKKICVLKNCNKNIDNNINYPKSIRNEIHSQLNNTPCPKSRTPLNNVYNKFYLN